MSLRSILALLLTAFALSACSAIVGSPLDPGAPIRCEIIDGFDPCPVPSSCVDFYCTITFDVCNGLDDNANGIIDEGSPDEPPCDGGARCIGGACLTGCSNEICNGEDDDCDGDIDELLDVDLDMDRISACPTNDDPPDCDDSNASVHPGSSTLGIDAAMETCNGLDDDCNPATGEDVVGTVCPTGSVCQRLPGAVSPICIDLSDCRLTGCTSPDVCDTATRLCALPPDDCRGGAGCPSPLECSEATGNCEQPPPGMTGEDCDDGSECGSKLCMPREAMGLPPSTHMGICGLACCSNADCGSGERCWAPGTGARSCVTAAVYGDASAELCSLPGNCGGSCRLGSVTYTAGAGTSSFDGMLCLGSVSGGDSQYCDYFGLPVPCANGACLDNGACANPCGSTADCDRQYSFAFRNIYYDPICDYRLSSGSLVTACVPPPHAGTGTTGTSCTSNAGCRDDFCVSGRCADVCCSDASCPGSHRCAPIGATLGTTTTSLRDVWLMRCVPDGTTPD